MTARARYAGRERWKVFSPGYGLVLEPPDEAAQHTFCGAHRIPGAWCFYGDHPLLRLLSLDTADERLGLADLGVPQVHLLYCWRCDVGDLDYRLERDGSVSVFGEKEWGALLRQRGVDIEEVRARLRQPETDYPYSGYPAAFPSRSARLVAVAQDDEQALLAAERGEDVSLPEALTTPKHQVGGLPYLVQGTSYIPACPGCGADMAFVATIADDCGDPRGFVGNEWVQVVFFLCADCKRVHALNMAD